MNRTVPCAGALPVTGNVTPDRKEKEWESGAENGLPMETGLVPDANPRRISESWGLVWALLRGAVPAPMEGPLRSAYYAGAAQVYREVTGCIVANGYGAASFGDSPERVTRMGNLLQGLAEEIREYHVAEEERHE